LPIGLSCPVKFVVCHSRDRDTRWAFCYSRGRGVGMLKMADFRAIVSTIAGIAIVGADATSFIGVPIQIAFPVAVLVVLTRPNIKEAFQSSGF
jgi:hypothetical protein